jgi:glycosyltransferase involved in cell wall biosynthesis
MPSVSVLLPTLNEEDNIGRTITEVRAAVPEAEIVVIDGLSTDRTVEIAKSLGARVLMEKRKGKGFAIQTAFREIDSDYAVMLDADLTYPVKDIPKFLSLLADHDVVIGSRFRGKLEDGSMPLLNGLGNQAICLVASVLYLRPVSDVCTGMWAFRKSAYKAIEVTAHTFELECNLFAQSVKKGFRILEIPIDYARRGGMSKVQLMDGVKDCVFLLKERFRP